MELIQVAFTYAPLLEAMQVFPERPAPPERPITLEEFAAGIPIDYFQRMPPGMPLQGESETYHSYVPGEQEELGAPNGDPRSPGVLHPFLHALLARRHASASS
jgi:hypothetical protein